MFIDFFSQTIQSSSIQCITRRYRRSKVFDNRREMARVNHRLAHAPIAQEPQQLLTAIKVYERESIVSLEQACIPLLCIVCELEKYICTAKMNSKHPVDGLTQDESASICIYTMEWEISSKSLYAVLNRTLRRTERSGLRPWYKYLKLLLTALFKLPSVDSSCSITNRLICCLFLQL
jgi:hypothetical protein